MTCSSRLDYSVAAGGDGVTRVHGDGNFRRPMCSVCLVYVFHFIFRYIWNCVRCLRETKAHLWLILGRPFVKRFDLCYQTVVYLSCHVVSVCLSETLAHCGQTVGWIKMKLGMQVAPPPPKGHSPQFSAHICCGQMAEWIKMPLGMEVGLGPGDFVLDGNPALLPQKGGGAFSQIFGQCPLWQNGWMGQDASWYRGKTRPRGRCVRWGRSSPSKRGTVPQFSVHVYCGQMAGWMKTPLGTEVDHGQGHIMLHGDSAPPRKGHISRHLFVHVYWPRSPISATAENL